MMSPCEAPERHFESAVINFRWDVEQFVEIRRGGDERVNEIIDHIR